MKEKRISESYTEQVQMVTQADLNGYGRLFGGKLMKWIDTVAAVCARRHAESNVTTVVVDTLRFKAPAYANDAVILAANVTYVGNTSMEVRVRTYVEALSGDRELINEAYLVFVSLDEREKPKQVNRLIVETEEEKKDWENAKLRKEIRQQYKF